MCRFITVFFANSYSGLVVLCLAGCGKAEKMTADVTPFDLVQECDEDEVAATARYRDKRLRLKSTANEKIMAFGGRAALTIGTSSRHVTLHGVSVEQAAGIKVEETEFAAYCDWLSCAGEMVHLDNCNLVVPE